MGDARRREVRWQDPAAGAAAAGELSGLEYFQRMAAGELPMPPIAALLGMSLEEVAPGRVVFALRPGEYHFNPIGMVHGGVAATLIDSAASCAVHSELPAGVAYTTLDLHVSYVRAIRAATGRLRCIGMATHVGSRVATATTRLIDDEERLYAQGTVTCLVITLGG